MTDIRYKIVYVDWEYKDQNNLYDYTEVLLSFWAELQTCVTYIPGQFVEAPVWLAEKGYHLLVFNSEKDCEPYQSPGTVGRYSSYLQQWECECEDEVFPLPTMLDLSELKRKAFVPTILKSGWPQGTRMYKRVKLTRRMK